MRSRWKTPLIRSNTPREYSPRQITASTVKSFVVGTKKFCRWTFEDAIRNAISLGGDSDTLAAIAGSIAEAMHGVPRDLVEKAKQYLPSDIIDVLERLYRR